MTTEFCVLPPDQCDRVFPRRILIHKDEALEETSIGVQTTHQLLAVKRDRAGNLTFSILVGDAVRRPFLSSG